MELVWVWLVMIFSGVLSAFVLWSVYRLLFRDSILARALMIGVGIIVGFFTQSYMQGQLYRPYVEEHLLGYSLESSAGAALFALFIITITLGILTIIRHFEDGVY